MKIGLVLEGGGMRGAYTAGVLAWFLDNNIEVDYAVGISSGAEHLCTFLGGSKENLRRVAVDIASTTKVGPGPLLKEGSLVGYDDLFNKIVIQEKMLDLDKIRTSKIDARFGVYSLSEFETTWIKAQDMDDKFQYLKAACTLPLAGKPVKIDGVNYLDGGITTMIPVGESIKNGCEKHLIVTTKPASFVRKPTGAVTNFLMWCMYHKYPKLLKDLDARTDVYYRELDQINHLVKEGNALHLQPSSDLGIKRFSGDAKKLGDLFDTAYQDCENRKEEILTFVKK